MILNRTSHGVAAFRLTDTKLRIAKRPYNMTWIWVSDGPFSRWTKKVRMSCTFSSYISIFFFNLDIPVIDHEPFMWCGKYLIPWKLSKHSESSIVCPIT